MKKNKIIASYECIIESKYLFYSKRTRNNDNKNRFFIDLDKKRFY